MTNKVTTRGGQPALPGVSFDPINLVPEELKIISVNAIEMGTDVPVVGNQMLKQLATMGQVKQVPIILDNGNGTFTPIYGAVWVQAFRHLCVDARYTPTFDPAFIKCRVITQAWNIPPELLRLISADEAARDEIDEFEAIMQAINNGSTHSEIYHQTGMGVNEQKRLLKKYSGMPPALRDGVRRRQLTAETAAKATKLPPAHRAEVINRVGMGDKISQRELKDIKVEVQKATATKKSQEQMAAWAGTVTVSQKEYAIVPRNALLKTGDKEQMENEAMLFLAQGDDVVVVEVLNV